MWVALGENPMRIVKRHTLVLLLSGIAYYQPGVAAANDNTDAELGRALANSGFSGRIESTLVPRLGRPLNPQLANLGRMLWFDVVGGLHSDNTCGGCHSPTNGFGDTQSIAIGIQNNNIVGPHRTGPRNQRRTPMAIGNVIGKPKYLVGCTRVTRKGGSCRAAK